MSEIVASYVYDAAESLPEVELQVENLFEKDVEHKNMIGLARKMLR